MTKPCLAVLRTTGPSLCLALAVFLAASGSAPAQQAALLAHDLSGFTLDMTYAQVTLVATKPLTWVGTDQYQVTVDGIDYNFTFSAQGHLYRIDSRQVFGHITLDSNFVPTLIDRLTQKFGPPQSNQLLSGPAIWMFQESYTGPKGEKLTRESESLIVLVNASATEPVSVEIQLAAPRIQRRDAEPHPPHRSDPAPHL
jgi:hypothetical protein